MQPSVGLLLARCLIARSARQDRPLDRRRRVPSCVRRWTTPRLPLGAVVRFRERVDALSEVSLPGNQLLAPERRLVQADAGRFGAARE